MIMGPDGLKFFARPFTGVISPPPPRSCNSIGILPHLCVEHCLSDRGLSGADVFIRCKFVQCLAWLGPDLVDF